MIQRYGNPKFLFAAAAGVAAAALLPGCSISTRPDFASDEPDARNAAIVQAVRRGDEKALPDLVRMLDSDDAGTRLLAINALERLTGETMGYDHAAPEVKRDQAALRWQVWIRSRAATTADAPLEARR